MFEEDMETKLPICTVGYLVRGTPGQEEIFLGEKAPTPKAVKRKIAGKLIGYGGDFEPDHDASIAESFKRELAEESGFTVETTDVEVMAEILIRDETGDRLMLYYVLVKKWRGEANDNREILNPRWYPTRPLPDNILGADKLILPIIIDGKRLSGWVRYDKDMNITDYKLEPVETL